MNGAANRRICTALACAMKLSCVVPYFGCQRACKMGELALFFWRARFWTCSLPAVNWAAGTCSGHEHEEEGTWGGVEAKCRSRT